MIHLAFPDLSEDPETDPIWVSLRNPRLIPPGELRPDDLPVDPATGRPLDESKATDAMYGIFAKLIIGWRVYDASVIELDPATGEVLDQPPLPHPANAASVAKLPIAIINRITEEFTAAVAPKSDPGSPTTRTSSSPPNPSTAEPGVPALLPANSSTSS